MEGANVPKIFHILLCISGCSFICSSKTVIYETDEPKTVQLKNNVIQQNASNATGHYQRKNDMTRIQTDHFIVSIAKNKKNQSLPAVKEVNGSTDVIKMGQPLVHDEESTDTENHQITKENVPESVQDTLRAAIMGEIIDKLKQSSGNNAGTKNFVSNTVQLYTTKEEVPRKREVTDMFVKFLEDLSKRLNLDVVTVAEQLISRSSERNEDMEMAAGYARNIIPSIPVMFKPIIKSIAKLVNKEITSARLLV